MYKAPIKNITLFEQPVPHEVKPGEQAPVVPAGLQRRAKPPGGTVVIDPKDLTNEQYAKILIKFIHLMHLAP